MYPRLAQVARHLSRPLPNLSHSSAIALRINSLAPFQMASTGASTTVDERGSRSIHTAACLIIGDEVLGGKVCLS